MTISVVAIISVVSTLRAGAKYAPAIAKAAKEFIEA
jgi:hypothetical protein